MCFLSPLSAGGHPYHPVIDPSRLIVVIIIETQNQQRPNC
jgi:hypothetical protein